jgi:hypothetical protein
MIWTIPYARQAVMSRNATLYDPINQYKPFAAGIGVVDGPFEYLTMAGIKLPLPFTTRMTVVQLKNGELFLHSPIALNLELARQVQSMGTISYLVSPNQFHYAHIGEWSRAFPDATTWGRSGARRRARARGIDVRFDHELASSPPAAWADEIDQTAVPGGIFGEIVFFHKASRTLILTDTIFNLELDKIDEPWRSAAHLTGIHHPHGQVFFGMRLPLFLQRRRARAAIEKILSWEPQRIILSHGRCFDANAAEVLDRLFARYR